MKFFIQVKFFIEFVKYTRNPSAEGVEKLILVTKKMRTANLKNQIQEIVDHVKTNEDSKKIVESRYKPQKFTLEQLKDYPPDTLGQAFYQHMTTNQLKLDIYAEFKIDSDIDYISYRGSQLHDLWHVVTGYKIDHFGEFAIQAFTFSQTKSSLVALFLAGDLIYSARKGPNWCFEAFKAMCQGFALGLQVKNFYSIPWEDSFPKSLTEIRKQLNVTEVIL